MKNARFVPNTIMNETICRCFELISKEDVKKFKRKFKQQTGGEQQTDRDWLRTHTFRELILGAHLCRSGLCARYEWQIDAETLQRPDWSIVGEREKVVGIVELLSLHADKAAEDAFWKPGLRFVERLDNDRLYDKTRQKIVEYNGLVEKCRVPFAVAVFLQPPVVVQLAERSGPILDLFKSYPELSGIMFIGFGTGNYPLSNYCFRYFENPKPLREFNLLHTDQGPQLGTL
jgi:hypothetical protein